LTHELITNLMRFRDLHVYSASSNERWAKDPAGFAQQLQVNYEVKGSGRIVDAVAHHDTQRSVGSAGRRSSSAISSNRILPQIRRTAGGNLQDTATDRVPLES
jgi:hypothetical protein